MGYQKYLGTVCVLLLFNESLSAHEPLEYTTPENDLLDNKGILSTIGDVAINGSLTVIGSTTVSSVIFTGTLYNTSGQVLADDLIILADATVGGNLILNGTLDAQSNATLNGVVSIENDATIEGTLTAESYKFSTQPPTGTPGILGFGGFLAYGQLYTTDSFSVITDEVIPLNTPYALAGGMSVNGHSLQVPSKGIYIIYYYAVSYAASDNPLLLAVAVNNIFLPGGTCAGIAEIPLEEIEQYNRYSQATGIVLASLQANDTVSLANELVTTVDQPYVQFSAYTDVNNKPGTVASLIVARIA